MTAIQGKPDSYFLSTGRERRSYFDSVVTELELEFGRLNSGSGVFARVWQQLFVWREVPTATLAVGLPLPPPVALCDSMVSLHLILSLLL